MSYLFFNKAHCVGRTLGYSACRGRWELPTPGRQILGPVGTQRAHTQVPKAAMTHCYLS